MSLRMRAKPSWHLSLVWQTSSNNTRSSARANSRNLSDAISPMMLLRSTIEERTSCSITSLFASRLQCHIGFPLNFFSLATVCLHQFLLVVGKNDEVRLDPLVEDM